MSETIDQSNSDPTTEEAPWWLVIAHHPDPDAVGERVIVAPGGRVKLGRGSELGNATLDDKRLSREHAEAYVDERGRLCVQDLGSRNGTHVGEDQVTSAKLRVGEMVRIGSILLIADRSDPSEDTPGTELVGASASHRRIVGQINQIAPLDSPVLVTGQPGVGKTLVARSLHAASGRRGELVEVSCGGVADSHVHQQLFGTDDDNPGLLGRAAGGTLVFDGLEHAGASLQSCIHSMVSSGTYRRVGESEARPLEARVVATCLEQDLPGLRDDVRNVLAGWLIEIPPLRRRPVDIALLAEHFATDKSGEPTRFHYHAVTRLLAHPWIGNARELRQVVDRAVIESEAERPIRITPAIDALGSADAAPTPTSTSVSLAAPADALVVAFDGRWFRVPEGEQVDLGRRQNLTLILKALADRRRERPGKGMGVKELLALGWPGTRILERAGQNRVYVAVATLRKLGLANYLERTDDGYLLDPEVPLFTDWGER